MSDHRDYNAESCGARDPRDSQRRCLLVVGHAEMDQGGSDYSAECLYAARAGVWLMTKEKAHAKLDELLHRGFLRPGEVAPVLTRFSLVPPPDLDAAGLATWAVGQIAERDLRSEVVAFQTEASSGCSCRLEDGSWGAGGHHYSNTDATYWWDRSITDMMADRGTGSAYSDEFINSMSQSEMANLENYCERMAGTPIAVEPCPVYRASTQR